MPLPAAPTALFAVPSPDDGWVTLSWTPPAGTLTGTKIESSADAGTTWTALYDDVAISTRNVWPVPLQTMAYRVSSKTASGYGPTIAIYGVTLGLHGWPMFGMSLVSLSDTTKKVLCLGAGSFGSMPGFGLQRGRSKLALAGQVDPTYFFSVQLWRVASGVQFLIPSYNLQSGARVQATDTLDMLESLEGAACLWRDASRKKALYVMVGAVKPSPTANGVWTASLDLESAAAPAFPLTS